MLIAYAVIKGGVGKSTLAVHHAVWLHDAGYRVAFIDADSLRISITWMRLVEPTITAVRVETPQEARKAIAKLEKDHDYIIADGPGGPVAVNAVFLEACSLSLVPFAPSGPEVFAALTSVPEFVREVRKKNRGCPKNVRFLVNKLDLRTRASREVVKQVVPALPFPTCKTKLSLRTWLGDAFTEKTVATRMKGRRGIEARRELGALFDEVTPSISRRSVANV